MRKLNLFLLSALMLSAQASQAAFSKAILFSANGATNETAQENVPVLIRLNRSIPNFSYADFNAGHTDIKFTQLGVDGALPYEVESWDETGTSYIWVKVPSLAAGTKIRMEFGSSDAADLVANTPTDVWSDYSAVWHFSELHERGAAADSCLDSTINANHTVNTEITSSVSDGVVGVARKVSDEALNGAAGKIYAPHSDVFNGSTITISGWFRRSGFPTEGAMNSWIRLFSKKNSGSSQTSGFHAEFNGSAAGRNQINFFGSGGSIAQSSFSADIPVTEWIHFACVFSKNGSVQELRTYFNGELASTGKLNAIANNTIPLYLGGCGQQYGPTFKGDLDEFRFRQSALSADQVSLLYQTMANPNFMTADAGVFNNVEELPLLGSEVGLEASATDFTVSGSMASGTGVLRAGYVLGDGTEYVVLLSETPELGTAYSYTFTGLPANQSCRFFVESAVSADSDSIQRIYAGDAVYTGLVSLTAEPQAGMKTLVTVSRDSSANAIANDLAVSFDKTAVGYGEVVLPFEDSIVIPAGQSSVSFPLIAACGNPENSSFTIALTKGNYYTDSSSSVTVSLPSADTIYVATTGDDANEGIDPAAPKKTIQAGVGAFGLVNGGTVRVEPGKYNTAKSITLTNPLLVTGTTGTPEDVIVHYNGSTGWGACDPIFVLNHINATVSSLTMTNGVHNNNSDIASVTNKAATLQIFSKGGTVTNCVITKGSFKNATARTAGAYINSTNALITHTRFTANSVTGGQSWSHDYGSAAFIEKGRIENCLFTENTSSNYATDANPDAATVIVISGTLMNSTFIGNKAARCGGATLKGTGKIINCAFFGNIASTAVMTDSPGNVAWWTTGSGAAERFINCASDAPDPISDSCFGGLAEVDFANYAAGDYRPTIAGLLYNKGADVETAETDFIGNPRRSEGRFDIGAYETVFSPSMLMVF